MTRFAAAEDHIKTPPDDAARRRWWVLALRLAAPAGFLIAALVLPSFMLDTTRPLRGTGLGPAAWPQAMLVLIAVCAVIWMAQTVIAWRGGRPVPAATAAAPAGETYSHRKALIGLVLIVAYGWLLPVTGFPLATAAFIALWCILGGVRHPLAVVPLSLVGTVVLLWIFMGLALMPLSRGQGVFDQVSVTILQLLRIY
jgi:putative tricarboxylic transport membrane protein